MHTPSDFNDRMLSLGLARVPEAAAIASAFLVGRGGGGQQRRQGK